MALCVGARARQTGQQCTALECRTKVKHLGHTEKDHSETGESASDTPACGQLQGGGDSLDAQRVLVLLPRQVGADEVTLAGEPEMQGRLCQANERRRLSFCKAMGSSDVV